MQIEGEIELNERGRRSLELRHPWIYQRSFKALPKLEKGSLVRVNASGRSVAVGFFDPDSLYAVKVLDWSDGSVDLNELVARRIANAQALRTRLQCGSAYRLLHGEADGIPGLFIDIFGKVGVMKFEHLGAFRLRGAVIEAMRSQFPQLALFEVTPRNERSWLGETPAGDLIAEIDGLKFIVDPFGQKTGFYLDQSENRRAIGRLIRSGDHLLDAFSYTGAFALYAARAGAKVSTVDSVEKHTALIGKNFALNEMKGPAVHVARAEEFLASTTERFDAVLLDPPSLVTRREQKKKALQYIHKLVERTMRVLRPGGLFAVSVCSHGLLGEELIATIRNGIASSGRIFRIAYEGGAAADHPVLLNFPEGEYLRCLAFREV